MADLQNPTVQIVGAGSMGLVTGYHLTLAGAHVTYLVRPKRAEELTKPQLLYRLDTQEIHEYKSYSHFIDPSSMLSSTHDYIRITIDGKSLQSEEGEELVRIIGQAARGKTANVLVGSVLLVARDYAGLGILSLPKQTALTIFPIFAVFIGLELLGWTKLKDIDIESEVWKLTAVAAKEIQMLDPCGEAGTQTDQTTSENTFVEMFAYLEEKLCPLDFQAFNQFHHGGKLVEQDRMHIQRCISQGVAEGKPMSALKALLQSLNCCD
ncbi:Ketopantoate reductase domain protein [Fusarium sp. NRRL 52700]|nr:Ketopantoate reductase domain protein [Fusarium sp. NRRL 52700]